MECRVGRSIFLTLCCLERPRMSLRLSGVLRLLWLSGENQQRHGRCQPPGEGGVPGLRRAKLCRDAWEDTLESDRGQSPEVCCRAICSVPRPCTGAHVGGSEPLPPPAGLGPAPPRKPQASCGWPGSVHSGAALEARGGQAGWWPLPRTRSWGWGGSAWPPSRSAHFPMWIPPVP